MEYVMSVEKSAAVSIMGELQKRNCTKIQFLREIEVITFNCVRADALNGMDVFPGVRVIEIGGEMKTQLEKMNEISERLKEGGTTLYGTIE